MEKIAITGGKGGTGKSTIAVLLAKKYINQGRDVILVDCDVECPNDHLLLGQKLKEAEEKIDAPYPVLDKEKCTKCGKCVDACSENAIFQKPGEYPQFLHDLCSSCGACWEICPEGAIEKEKKEIGRTYLNQIKTDKKKEGFYLVTGEAKANLEETGPIVKETLNYAENLTQKRDIDIMLIDTAAGTHCPVTNALVKSDFAYAVTEPTPMGTYDLELILQLLNKINIPKEIILNQANLGNKKMIYKIAEKYNTPIIQELSYSEEIARAYSEGNISQFNTNNLLSNLKVLESD